MKTNNFFVKLLISMLIVLTLFNFISSTGIEINYSFATTEDTTTSEERVNAMMEGTQSGLLDIIMNGIKTIILSIFKAARSLTYVLAAAGGTQYQGVSHTPGEITPFDIFFNKFTLLDANIFSTADRDGNLLDTESLVYKIRTNTAIWYYGIRTIAIAIIAVMLLLNLARILAKGSTPDKKVIAKNSAVDWVLSFALVMFMHIIIIFVLNFNDLILKAIEKIAGEMAQSSNFFDALENAVFNTNFILSVAALVVYALLIWQTFKYILTYIQRLLTIVLLIMISPIIPVTYSTDKMRGGKGAALNNWLKELIFNVFIQSLHALIYAALVGVAMASLTSSTISATSELGNALVAIAAMLFIKYAEKLLKSILGFDSSQVLNTNVFANAYSAVSNFSNSMMNRVTNPPGTGVQFGQNINAPGVNGVIPGMGGFGKNVGMNAQGQGALPGGIKQNGSLLGGMKNVLNGKAADKIGDKLGGDGNQLGIGAAMLGDDGAIDVMNGMDGKDGENGIATAEAKAEAKAEATAEARVEGQSDDSKGKIGAVILGGESIDEKDKQKTKDMLQDEKTDNLKQGVDEELSEKDKKMRGLEKAIKGVSKSTQKQATNNELLTEETLVEDVNINENEEDIDVLPGGGTLDEESIRRIVDELKEKITPELLDKVKEVLNDDIKPELLEAIGAVTSGDDGKIGGMKNDLNGQLNMLAYNYLGGQTASKIDGAIDSRMNNPEALRSYITSLPEGSNERNYAETYAKLSSLMAIDNKNMSSEEKIQSLLNTNNAINGNNSEMGPSDLSNEGATSTDANSTGSTRTMQAVNDAMENGLVEDIEDEIEDDSAFDNIENEDLKNAAIGLSRLGYNVKGMADGELETEIREEFEANFEHFTEMLGRTPEGLDDIYRNMDAEAQKQFAEYSRQELDPKELKGDARALAALQIQASRLGFAMQSENEYQYRINQGEVRTSTTTQGVITELEKYKNQKEQEMRNKRNAG